MVGASVKIARASGGSIVAEVQTDSTGEYLVRTIETGKYQITASATGFTPVTKSVSLPQSEGGTNLQFEKLAAQSDSVVITAKTVVLRQTQWGL